MSYKIHYKAQDDGDVTNCMNEVESFLKWKGYLALTGGLTIQTFFKKDESFNEDMEYLGLEVDCANKTLWYGWFMYTDENIDDLDVGVVIEDMEILKFFDRKGFELHPSMAHYTDQRIEDWYDNDEV